MEKISKAAFVRELDGQNVEYLYGHHVLDEVEAELEQFLYDARPDDILCCDDKMNSTSATRMVRTYCDETGAHSSILDMHGTTCYKHVNKFGRVAYVCDFGFAFAIYRPC